MESHSASGEFGSEEAIQQHDLPRVWLTWVLVAANVLIYVAMAIAIGNPLSFPAKDLLAWGGDFAPNVASGEYWRPFTAIFLHAGLIHLGLNMWVLTAIGPFLERLFGVTTFLLIYLLAGLSGNIFGMLWNADAVGVGASGAIFGLYGGLLGFLLVRRNVIPSEVLRPLLQNGLYFLGVNLVLGFSIPGIDVAAHVLGAVAGFLGGVAASWPLVHSPRSAWLVRNALLAALCVIVCAALPLCIPASAKAQARFLAAMDSLGAREDVLIERYNALITRHEGAADRSAFADELEQDVLEPWTEMHQQFPPLAELPANQQAKPMIPKIYSYLATMQEAFELLVEANRQGDEALERRANAKFQEAAELMSSTKQ